MRSLSILILTHNRPDQFKRCLDSALCNKPDNVEILVNYDRCDYHVSDEVRNFYFSDQNISKIYYKLLLESKNEFIFYLEDDDYLVKNFYDIVLESQQNTIFNYIKKYNINLKPKNNKDFEFDFQLSQMVMKRDDLLKIKFPDDNNTHNDYLIYKQLNFEQSNKIIFIQTTDAKDNISFPEYNKDPRFITNNSN